VSHIFDSFICGRVRDSFIHVGEFVTPEWRGGQGRRVDADADGEVAHSCMGESGTHSYVGTFVTHL